MGPAVTNRRSLCPVCRSRLDRIRLSSTGSQYGCGKCGKWFRTDEIQADRDALPAKTPPSAQAEPASDSHALTKASIILGLKSRALPEAVDELVPKALQGTPTFLKSSEIAHALREDLGFDSVEFRRGLAYLHRSVDVLLEPRAALGISRDGLDPGARIRERVFVVALFLKPAREAGFAIPLWARRKLSNERTIFKLRKAADVDAVLQILQSA